MHLGLIKEIWRASLGVEAQMVKNLPAMQETRVQSLGHEDPLEEDMSTHSSILAWRIPWTEEPRGLQSMKVMQVFFTQSCLTLQCHLLKPARFLCPWGFSGQEYWSGLPFPSPGDLPKPRIRGLF